jgi:hypothetical protein
MSARARSKSLPTKTDLAPKEGWRIQHAPRGPSGLFAPLPTLSHRRNLSALGFAICQVPCEGAEALNRPNFETVAQRRCDGSRGPRSTESATNNDAGPPAVIHPMKHTTTTEQGAWLGNTICRQEPVPPHEQNFLVGSLILLITESGGRTSGHRR